MPASRFAKILIFMSSKFSKYFDNPNSLAILAGWMALFLAAVMAYWPGLAGPFILDDEVSISALGVLGGVRDWETFKLFVFGGTSGPTGRPLALLSFLIDGSTWPTDPWPFKRTNLIIHLINGALLGRSCSYSISIGTMYGGLH
jgi:hypothetical protein